LANEVMKKLEYWIKKSNLMINFGKTVAISHHTKISDETKISNRNTDIA
jgi:hypothetical protein